MPLHAMFGSLRLTRLEPASVHAAREDCMGTPGFSRSSACCLLRSAVCGLPASAIVPCGSTSSDRAPGRCWRVSIWPASRSVMLSRARRRHCASNADVGHRHACARTADRVVRAPTQPTCKTLQTSMPCTLCKIDGVAPRVLRCARHL